MSYGYLSQMLEYLTGAYARSDIRNSRHSLPMETNIGRLFGTLAWGLEIIHENADRLKLWDDIDNARGSVLDRYGANFGVARGGADDTFYRLLIKIKMIALLSGGDIDTIISAAASLFNVDVSEIEVRELFPAKIWIYVDEAVLDYERLEAAPLIAGADEAHRGGRRRDPCFPADLPHSTVPELLRGPGADLQRD